MKRLLPQHAVLIVGLGLVAASTPILDAQKHAESTPGLAWAVKGEWQEAGQATSIQSGDSIYPGALLRPVDLNATHSISVLVPDGQRFLYECFTPEDCARGFRIPPLYRTPLPLAVEMIARIHAGLAEESQHRLTSPNAKTPALLPRDESVVAFGTDHRVQIAGLATRLGNGKYTYDLHPLDRTIPTRFQVPVQKTGATLGIELPQPGLYTLTIRDDLNTDRIDLFVAAVMPDKAAQVKKSFADAKVLMTEWNTFYQGWPVHEFFRAYLESLIGGGRSSATLSPSTTQSDASKQDVNAERVKATMDASAITAEPAFTPAAGMMKGTTAIKLRCETANSSIHFTVDGSQPIATSPVYQGAIMLKGTEITIKAFASSPSKKDSPVVTGIFVVEGSDPD